MPAIKPRAWTIVEGSICIIIVGRLVSASLVV